MPSPMIRKIENFTALSDEERQVLDDLLGRTKEVGADQDIVSDGERPRDANLILEGLACRYKLLEDGRRQIMSFHLPGDIVDLHSFLLEKMDHSIGTLTPCKVALIPHQTLLGVIETYPRIAQALWRDTLIDAAVFREWLVGIGQRTSYERVAHLLCEMLVRYKAVGLAADHHFELPVTQTELGDALGLSLVHVNRTLQEIRGDGLITWRGKRVVIDDWEGLTRAAMFDPDYLHLGKPV